MPYRRSSYVQFGDTSRTATTGKGTVVKKPSSPTRNPEKNPSFTINATEGDTTSATITGTFPNFHIELVVKKGTDGIDGDDGVCECDCECCNGGGGDDVDPPPCEEGYYRDESGNCVPTETPP